MAVVKVFDILYIEIEGAERPPALANLPLKHRKKTLRSFGLFKEVKGRFEFVTESEGSTVKDVEMQLQQIVESRLVFRVAVYEVVLSHLLGFPRKGRGIGIEDTSV